MARCFRRIYLAAPFPPSSGHSKQPFPAPYGLPIERAQSKKNREASKTSSSSSKHGKVLNNEADPDGLAAATGTVIDLTDNVRPEPQSTNNVRRQGLGALTEALGGLRQEDCRGPEADLDETSAVKDQAALSARAKSHGGDLSAEELLQNHRPVISGESKHANSDKPDPGDRCSNDKCNYGLPAKKISSNKGGRPLQHVQAPNGLCVKCRTNFQLEQSRARIGKRAPDDRWMTVTPKSAQPSATPLIRPRSHQSATRTLTHSPRVETQTARDEDDVDPGADLEEICRNPDRSNREAQMDALLEQME